MKDGTLSPFPHMFSLLVLGFVVDKGALGWVLSKYCPFFCKFSFHRLPQTPLLMVYRPDSDKNSKFYTNVNLIFRLARLYISHFSACYMPRPCHPLTYTMKADSAYSCLIVVLGLLN
jgi:hypothetical protein